MRARGSWRFGLLAVLLVLFAAPAWAGGVFFSFGFHHGGLHFGVHGKHHLHVFHGPFVFHHDPFFHHGVPHGFHGFKGFLHTPHGHFWPHRHVWHGPRWPQGRVSPPRGGFLWRR